MPDLVAAAAEVSNPAFAADVLRVLRIVQDMRTAQRKIFQNKSQALKAELFGAARSAESRADIAVSDLIERLQS